jgi:hypothetical protein
LIAAASLSKLGQASVLLRAGHRSISAKNGARAEINSYLSSTAYCFNSCPKVFSSIILDQLRVKIRCYLGKRYFVLLRLKILWSPGYDPPAFDSAFPVDSPNIITTTSTMLDCGRLCVEDPKCEGYAVARNKSPIENTDCYIFYTVTGLQFDPHHVSLVSNNELQE